MPISTKLTKTLGITHPLIQGGMHYVGYAPLAAAVSNAGAIGCITALTMQSPELLQQEIRKCKELTSKPFGVNLTLLPMLKPPNYQVRLNKLKVFTRDGHGIFGNKYIETITGNHCRTIGMLLTKQAFGQMKNHRHFPWRS